MTWLIQHGDLLFLLFLAPWAGLLLDVLLPVKTIARLMICGIALLLPLPFGYEYTIPYADRLFVVLVGSTVYSLCSGLISGKTLKALSAIVMSILAFAACLFLAFMNGMSGSTEVVKSWRSGRYRVEYVRSQGFSGRPLETYQIRRYTLIPVLKKTLDVVRVDDENINACQVHFNNAKKIFDKCRGGMDQLNQ